MAVSIAQELTFSHKRVRITHFSNNQSTDAPFTQTQSVSYQPYGAYGSILSIGIKPNQLSWQYQLNTQSYPTYAGEVVQILSAYIDNVSIEGDVRTYVDMELIYKWFIAYMTIATQGVTGSPVLSNILRYDDDPITMNYPHRGWTLQIRPLSLPTLTYGTDVVVPNWQMEAAVVEDENMKLTQMMNSNLPALVTSQLTKLDANFGNGVENPFNYWSGSYNQFDLNKFLNKASQKSIEALDGTNSTQLTDWFHTLVDQYATGSVDLTESSVPFSKAFTKNPNIDISTTITAGSQSTSSTTGSLNLNTPPIAGVAPTTNSQYPQLLANGQAAAPVDAPNWLGAAIAAGNQINSTPYVLGGGHGVPLTSPSSSYDCSSSSSYVLFYAGLLGSSEALDSEELASWGASGPGQWITVYANPGAGENGHAFLFIGNVASSQGVVWDTVPDGASVPPGSGPRWQAGSTLNYHIANDDNQMIVRHYPGY